MAFGAGVTTLGTVQLARNGLRAAMSIAHFLVVTARWKPDSPEGQDRTSIGVEIASHELERVYLMYNTSILANSGYIKSQCFTDRAITSLCNLPDSTSKCLQELRLHVLHKHKVTVLRNGKF